ncbi:MAG: 30S ribosomal protein S20 [Planctomycetia bacterium]|nr:30S ribosomal protein S20 [Planctomycetia bacterium]
MPNIRSAKKRLRQNVKRRTANLAIKRQVRHYCRTVRQACEAKDITAAETAFRVAVKHLDQAASKKILHKNTVSRVKSRLSARIKAVKTAE